VKDHYPNGIVTVYSSSSGGHIKLTVCIEDHKFSPRNFWNGRWRSEWTVTFTPGSSAELKGLMRVQVHYYEDGNVQLVSSKEVKESVKTSVSVLRTSFLSPLHAHATYTTNVIPVVPTDTPFCYVAFDSFQ
jgi:hypothetical protein